MREAASESSSRYEPLTHPSAKGYFQKLTELSSLQKYWYQVRQSKTLNPRFVKFGEKLLHNLAIIQDRLRNATFEFGPYQFFTIREKKMRSIANAPLKDRIAHWLLYEHLKNHWLKRFIPDTFGNLPGRGTHAAIKRISTWTRKPSLPYALQIDIAKYFASINHDYLKKTLLAREGNHHIQELLINVVDSYQTGTEFDHLFDENSPYRQTADKGMPLGNLTSQFFANIYLNEFDHWIKETLRVKHYIRYVDDMVFLASSVTELKQIKEQVKSKLLEIGLTINPKKIAIRKIEHGIPFLGYLIWPHHISAGPYVRKRFGQLLRKHNGINKQKSFAAYNGIFKHTGPTR